MTPRFCRWKFLVVFLTWNCIIVNCGKHRRQVFREDVSPLLGGKIPTAALDLRRLLFNNLDSRGISIPNGIIPSSDRNGDGGRTDENRLTLFSGDGDKDILSTYTLRSPVEFPLYPNPEGQPDFLEPANDAVGDNEGYDDGNDEYPHHHHNYHFHHLQPILRQPLNNDETYFHSAANFPHLKDLHVMKNYIRQKPLQRRKSPFSTFSTSGGTRSYSNYMLAAMNHILFPTKEILPFQVIIAQSPVTQFKLRRRWWTPKTEIWNAKYILSRIFTL